MTDNPIDEDGGDWLREGGGGAAAAGRDLFHFDLSRFRLEDGPGPIVVSIFLPLHPPPSLLLLLLLTWLKVPCTDLVFLLSCAGLQH